MALRIGIDVGGSKIEGIALVGTEERGRLRVATPRDDYAATLEAIVGVVAELEQQLDATGTVGLGIPGTVSPTTGLVKNANSTWLIGKPLRADLGIRLGRSVRVANDADCFAISEATDGAAIGGGVVFGVIVGTGTGAGIVVDGRVLSGPNSVAGEWGHNPMPWPAAGEWPGPACYCGKTGCIETFLSGPALEREHERVTGRREPAAAITSDEVLGMYEERMARALAAVINVLDPDVIVLGGGLSNIERLYRQVPARWGRFVFGAAVHPSERAATPDGGYEPVRTRLVRAAHGASSGVRGAAWLWE